MNKWLYYTVAVGLLPFLTRILFYLFVNTADINFLFSEVDFVIFGLVLCISNINILEHYSTDDLEWKTKSLAISVLLIFVFTIFFSLSLLITLGFDQIRHNSVKVITVLLSFSALFFSYAIYDRISKTSSSS